MTVGKSNLRSYKEESIRIVSKKKPYVTYLYQSCIFSHKSTISFFLKQHVLTVPILNNNKKIKIQ